jgi:hypothetical protein
LDNFKKLSIFDKFVYAFREFLLHHHDSLEFRAKLYTVPIVANPDGGECEMEKIERISREIYPNSRHRRGALLLIVREYMEKVHEPNGLGIDELIINIEKDLIRKKRFARKIHLEHIEDLIQCTKEKHSIIYQERILTLFSKLKKTYL